MTNYVRRLLIACEEAGFTMIAHYDGDIDYKGTSAAAAEDAITACDEMNLTIRDRHGKKVSWALIINSLEPDERFADYSGAWLDAWVRDNLVGRRSRTPALTRIERELMERGLVDITILTE